MGVMYAGQQKQRVGERQGGGDAVWLARQDIKRTWMAYPASAFYLGILGLFLGLGEAPGIGNYSFEFMMMALGFILATPFIARDYMSWATDPIAERLGWLRSLPIGVPTIVRSRGLAILAALPLNTIAFFMPVWFGSRWGMSGDEFLWFSFSIIGLSLVGAGATLALEMSVGIRRWILINIVSLVIGSIGLIALGLGLDIRLFEQLARAVAWNGPLVAIGSVVVGVAAFLGCARLAEHQLLRRELLA